jgi:hypothetical protein
MQRRRSGLRGLGLEERTQLVCRTTQDSEFFGESAYSPLHTIGAGSVKVSGLDSTYQTGMFCLSRSYGTVHHVE